MSAPCNEREVRAATDAMLAEAISSNIVHGLRDMVLFSLAARTAMRYAAQLPPEDYDAQHTISPSESKAMTPAILPYTRSFGEMQ